MKTTLVSLLTATFLAFVSKASGYALDATDFVTVAFAVCLVGWTMAQYNRAPRSLIQARPIRLPLNPEARPTGVSARRLAA